jgi:hypothetical protein
VRNRKHVKLFRVSPKGIFEENQASHRSIFFKIAENRRLVPESRLASAFHFMAKAPPAQASAAEPLRPGRANA